ncbi:hypothetical protein ACFLQL_00310 [Verrucomicrobiota bacterium]
MSRRNPFDMPSGCDPISFDIDILPSGFPLCSIPSFTEPKVCNNEFPIPAIPVIPPFCACLGEISSSPDSVATLSGINLSMHIGIVDGTAVQDCCDPCYELSYNFNIPCLPRTISVFNAAGDITGDNPTLDLALTNKNECEGLKLSYALNIPCFPKAVSAGGAAAITGDNPTLDLAFANKDDCAGLELSYCLNIPCFPKTVSSVKGAVEQGDTEAGDAGDVDAPDLIPEHAACAVRTLPVLDAKKGQLHFSDFFGQSLAAQKIRVGDDLVISGHPTGNKTYRVRERLSGGPWGLDYFILGEWVEVAEVWQWVNISYIPTPTGWDGGFGGALISIYRPEGSVSSVSSPDININLTKLADCAGIQLNYNLQIPCYPKAVSVVNSGASITGDDPTLDLSLTKKADCEGLELSYCMQIPCFPKAVSVIEGAVGITQRSGDPSLDFKLGLIKEADCAGLKLSYDLNIGIPNIGAPGPIGPIGPSGPSGPSGPPGPAGPCEGVECTPDGPWKDVTAGADVEHFAFDGYDTPNHRSTNVGVSYIWCNVAADTTDFEWEADGAVVESGQYERIAHIGQITGSEVTLTCTLTYGGYTCIQTVIITIDNRYFESYPFRVTLTGAGITCPSTATNFKIEGGTVRFRDGTNKAFPATTTVAVGGSDTVSINCVKTGDTWDATLVASSTTGNPNTSNDYDIWLAVVNWGNPPECYDGTGYLKTMAIKQLVMGNIENREIAAGETKNDILKWDAAKEVWVKVDAPADTGTFVLGCVDDEITWIATEECSLPA